MFRPADLDLVLTLSEILILYKVKNTIFYMYEQIFNNIEIWINISPDIIEIVPVRYGSLATKQRIFLALDRV